MRTDKGEEARDFRRESFGQGVKSEVRAPANKKQSHHGNEEPREGVRVDREGMPVS